MGGTHYFVLRQGGGWRFVTSLHFTTKKCPCLHFHNLQQDIANQHTHKVQASFNLVSASLKHMWLHISGQAAAFQERIRAINFTGKPTHVEKLIFQKLPQ